MTGRRAPRAVAWMVMAVGAIFLAQGAVIPAKATLAQWLLLGAWARAQGGVESPRPWAWADAWPVARLHFQETTQVVLAGTEGSALAFAPAWLAASAAPGRPGTTVIAAHRDTHFRGLGDLQRGAGIVLETAAGERFRYRVTGAEIHDVDSTSALTLREDGSRYLALVTCYPFDALAAGTRLRYVVWARAVES